MNIFKELGASGWQGARRQKAFAAECTVMCYSHKIGQFKGEIYIVIPDWGNIVKVVWVWHSADVFIISLVPIKGYTRHEVSPEGRITQQLLCKVPYFGVQERKLTKVNENTYVVPLEAKMADKETLTLLGQATLFLFVADDESVEEERQFMEAKHECSLKVHSREVVTRSGTKMTRVEWEVV